MKTKPNELRVYESDCDEDSGVSLHLSFTDNFIMGKTARIGVDVDGNHCGAYLGPRDAKRLADALNDWLKGLPRPKKPKS